MRKFLSFLFSYISKGINENRKREIIFASKDERKIIMVFLHNRANEDDDKDSHTIYSYVCMLCIFAWTENACLEIKQQQSIFYDIYVENTIGGMQMVY